MARLSLILSLARLSLVLSLVILATVDTRPLPFLINGPIAKDWRCSNPLNCLKVAVQTGQLCNTYNQVTPAPWCDKEEATPVALPSTKVVLDDQTNVQEERGGLHIFEIHVSSYGKGMVSTALLILCVVGCAAVGYKCCGRCKPVALIRSCCCTEAGAAHVPTAPPAYYEPAARYNPQPVAITFTSPTPSSSRDTSPTSPAIQELIEEVSPTQRLKPPTRV